MRKCGRAGPKNQAGLKRNFALARLALALALRRDFCVGVSKARSRRTSSMIPSASSLLLRRLRARSIGSPLRTMTSGIVMFPLADGLVKFGKRAARLGGDG